MKSIVLRLVLSLAAFCIVPDALAADGGNAFLDATFGETFGGSSTDHSGYFSNAQSAWGVDGGYLWKFDEKQSLGLDVGYVHFGNIPVDYSPTTFTSDVVSANALTLGGRFDYIFSDDKAWYFQARAGLMSVKFDASYAYFGPNPVTTGSASQRVSGEYLGVGIGRHITQNFSLILAYDHFDSSDALQASVDLDFLGLTAEYRF